MFDAPTPVISAPSRTASARPVGVLLLNSFNATSRCNSSSRATETLPSHLRMGAGCETASPTRSSAHRRRLRRQDRPPRAQRHGQARLQIGIGNLFEDRRAEPSELSAARLFCGSSPCSARCFRTRLPELTAIDGDRLLLRDLPQRLSLASTRRSSPHQRIAADEVHLQRRMPNNRLQSWWL